MVGAWMWEKAPTSEFLEIYSKGMGHLLSSLLLCGG